MAQNRKQHHKTYSAAEELDTQLLDTGTNHDIDGSIDFPDDEPLVEFRDGITRVIHEGHVEPDRDLISDLQAAIVAKWAVSMLDVIVVINCSLLRGCFDLYFVDTRRWPRLASMEVESSQEALVVAVVLLWHAGEQMLVGAVRQSTWLLSQPPVSVPRQTMGDITKPYLTVPTALLDHWLSNTHIGESSEADIIENRKRIMHTLRGAELCDERIPFHKLVQAMDGHAELKGTGEGHGNHWIHIFRNLDVEAAIKNATASGHEVARHLNKLRGMLQTGGKRRLAPAPQVAAIQSLKTNHPNFVEVIDYLTEQMALCHLRDLPVARFDPILLLGEPGVGKTYFAKQLAKTLESTFEFVAMSSLSAGWILSGTSSVWGTSRPGRIADVLLNQTYANPLIVLDELEKATGDNRYDPLGSLYGLLERDTARNFKDEYLEVGMDASHILWVGTANKASLPDPILSRFKLFVIQAAEGAVLAAIVQNAYRTLIEDFGGHFDTTLEGDVLDTLCSSASSTRDLCGQLKVALGRAALAGRNRIETRDLSIKPSVRRSIGFCG